MERWILVSNCQTYGLTNSFNLLNPNADVLPVDIWEYKKNSEKYNLQFSEYDRVVLATEIAGLPEFDPSGIKSLHYIPGFNFSAYHPDLCYLFVNDNAIFGPTDAYHSIICFAGYQLGLSIKETLKLYNDNTYNKANYYNRWINDRDAIVNDYKNFGLNISDYFKRWGRQGAFMYSVNHPKIHCLYEIAKAFLKTNNIEYVDIPLMPEDNLSKGAAFAIYPEIGERLGVEGAYRFKRINAYKTISLEDFIAESYESYEKYPTNSIIIQDHLLPVLNRIKELV